MAVHRTHKLLSSEKRLKILESQLYGRNEMLDIRSKKLDNEAGSSKFENPTTNIQSQYPSSRIQHPSSITDITYLKHDLTKIVLLSTLAIGVQILIKIFFERG